MSTVDIILALDEAIRTIKSKRADVAGGSDHIWNILYHAARHLETEVAALLSEEVAA